MFDDESIQRVLFSDEDNNEVAAELERIQRLLIFLGYPTSTSGVYTIDGDFGRSTNRGVARFQFEMETWFKEFRGFL